MTFYLFFFSSRRRHTRYIGDWSSDVCSSDLDPQEKEDEDPVDDEADNPPLREIEDAPHRPRPLPREAKKPSVPVPRLRPSQRYIARGGVGPSILHVRAGRIRRHLGNARADAPPDPRREPRRDPGLQLLRRVRGPHGPSSRVDAEAGLSAPPAPPHGGDAGTRPGLLRDESPGHRRRAGAVGSRAAARVPREPTVSHPLDGAEGSREPDCVPGKGLRGLGGSDRRARGPPQESGGLRPVPREGLIPAPGFQPRWTTGPSA